MNKNKSILSLMGEMEVKSNNFFLTKKEIIQSAEQFAKELVDSGNLNIQEKYAEIRRLKEAVDVIESEFKKALPDENFEAFGLKGTFRNGGAVANYDEDIVYASIKKQLDDRKNLLDAALKTDEPFYDSEGIEVPKVSKTERKSSLSISF